MKQIPVVYSARARADIERFIEFAESVEESQTVVKLLTEAVSILGNHPLIGRKISRRLRELVISRGKTGYVALYRVARQRVEILALRHQREVSFRS